MQKQIEFLPPPKFCNICGSIEVAFVSNAYIYGKPTGLWPYIYHCFNCSAAVGCHAKTRNPFGILANYGLARLRQDAHKLLDPIWKSGVLTRTEAYELSARILSMPVEKVHISWLSYSQLKHLIQGLKAYREQNERLIQRRSEKRRAKHRARIERQSTEQWRREHQRKNSFS